MHKKEVGGPHIQSGCSGEKKNLLPLPVFIPQIVQTDNTTPAPNHILDHLFDAAAK
jgi:hypothetical protein